MNLKNTGAERIVLICNLLNKGRLRNIFFVSVAGPGFSWDLSFALKFWK